VYSEKTIKIHNVRTSVKQSRWTLKNLYLLPFTRMVFTSSYYGETIPQSFKGERI